MPNKHIACGPNLQPLPIRPIRCNARGVRLLMECGFTHLMRVGHLKVELKVLFAELEA